MSDHAIMRRLVPVILVALPACAGAASSPAESPAVTPSPHPPASATPVPTASAQPPGAPPAQPTRRRFVATARASAEDIDDDTGPAPCDLDRSYRGTVGKDPGTSVTLLLRPKGDGLEGLGHYDNVAPAIPLSGKRTGDSFVVTEKSGGTFRGVCGPGGVLRGEVTIGKRKQPFVLHPRPATWPAMHRVTRTATAEPDHPICRKAGRPDAVVETSETEYGPRIVCLPRDPAARKRLLADAPDLLCTANDRSYRVFGLPDPRVEKAVNDRLGGSTYELLAKEIRGCSGARHFDEMARLTHVSRELIVVSSFRSDDFGGAHPMNAGGGSRAIDVRTGADLPLDRILDVTKLRDVASGCLAVFRQVPPVAAPRAQEPPKVVPFELEDAPPVLCGKDGTPRYLWSCSKDDIDGPVWSLLPEGIVIGAWANPHVSAYDDGHGPILPWDVLLRAGVLRADSPAARLWAGVAPAGPSALACTSSFDGEAIRTWRSESDATR